MPTHNLVPARRRLFGHGIRLAAVAVIAFSPVLQVLAAAPAPAELRAQLDTLLANAVPADGPGAVMLVARGDTVLYRSARGMASIELGVPLSPDQVLRIGSVTKQFSAAALLQLVDQGLAKLDDPLSKYLPSYPGADGITLQQLLNHTSGVKSFTSLPRYMGNPIRRDLSTAEMIAEFSGQPVDFAPGASWAYNNSGYVLVGAVIEAITKKTWHAQVAAMLQPLGLGRTQYDDPDRVISGMVSGYSSGAAGVERAGLVSMTQPHAAGALVSTVDELWRWNLALHRGRVLKPATYLRMVTPEGAPAQKAAYGDGIYAETLRGQPMLQHGGGIHGFKSVLIWLPAEQLSVVVLHNSDSSALNVGNLGRRVAAIALGQPFPDGPKLDLPVSELEKLQGVWRAAGSSAAADDRLLRVKDGALYAQRGEGRPLKLRPIAGGLFLFENALHRLETAPGSETLRYFEGGEGDGETWRRVGPLPP
ncbi:serine hydrolase domain-containing protein [Ideonella azotifigens]|uniref:Beta-lactamase-related domain-containing protein n=1 Tax=Ideonella azotifigens TaxID=513160 RepID=A0ABN1KLA4_9BURK|nr:serine hydrolase domain-containing protein [Ideonella azotifigens]